MMYSGTYTKPMLDRDNRTREAERVADERLKRLRAIVAEIRSRRGAYYVQCNCDLDRYEPERSTGHSFVCRIHKMAVAMLHKAKGGAA